MSNTINPYGASRSDMQRSVQPELEEEGLRPDAKRTEPGHARQKADAALAGPGEKVDQPTAPDQATVSESGTVNARFDATLEGAIDKPDAARDSRAAGALEGLSNDEQKMIYRYFPESPSLKLRLYKQDMSSNKVDPGSIGSRVDLRG